MSDEQTKIISVHKYRRVARFHERRLQRKLNSGWWGPEVPGWARGARVERIEGGLFAVVATSYRGR